VKNKNEEKRIRFISFLSIFLEKVNKEWLKELLSDQKKKLSGLKGFERVKKVKVKEVRKKQRGEKGTCFALAFST